MHILKLYICSHTAHKLGKSYNRVQWVGAAHVNISAFVGKKHHLDLALSLYTQFSGLKRQVTLSGQETVKGGISFALTKHQNMESQKSLTKMIIWNPVVLFWWEAPFICGILLSDALPSVRMSVCWLFCVLTHAVTSFTLQYINASACKCITYSQTRVHTVYTQIHTEFLHTLIIVLISNAHTHTLFPVLSSE